MRVWGAAVAIPTLGRRRRGHAPGTYSISVLSTPPGYVPAHDNQGTPGNGMVEVNRIVNIRLAAGVECQQVRSTCQKR